MGATTCPQASSEHVLPRNLLTGGLCKIRHLCSTAQKLVNNWPCNWKWVPLPAHKPRLNMFCPEISLLGAFVKSGTYVLLLKNLWTTDPAIGNGCHYLPTSLVWTWSCPEISLPGASVKSVSCVLLLANLWTTDPASGHECHYLPTSLVWTCFAQKSPYWGLV